MSKKLKTYLGISFGWTWLVGAALYIFRIPLDSVQGIAIIALLYMTAPFLSSVIAERGLIRERFFFPSLRSKGAILFFLSPVISVVLITGVYLLIMYIFGNILHISGFGTLATTTNELIDSASNLLGTDAVQKAGSPPPPAVLMLATLWGAIIAGWTINGLFAMGEEYGWRGLLWEELKMHGVIKANLLIGLIWGVWHGPLIIQGYNYPGHPIAGIFMMVLFTTSFSFVLTALRSLNKSVWPAAAAHGMFNGLAAMMIIIVLNGDMILTGPLGLLGVFVCGVIGAAIWRAMQKHNNLQA